MRRAGAANFSPASEERSASDGVGYSSAAIAMTEQTRRERDTEHKQETGGNLGQQEARSDAEMARMGELSREKNK